jgi:hypothetical protein
VKAKASLSVPVLASRAEALWYDTSRWPTFVDGLAHVEKVDGHWPDVGSRVVWTSQPGGRGRVVERSERHIVRAGQTVAVEDERLRGTQKVSFIPDGDACTVTLELEYELKQRGPLTPLVALFTRRPMRDALDRTLRRFRNELRDQV